VAVEITGSNVHDSQVLPRLLKVGNENAIFGQSKKYRRGHGMSIAPISDLKMRRADFEKGLSWPLPKKKKWGQEKRNGVRKKKWGQA